MYKGLLIFIIEVVLSAQKIYSQEVVPSDIKTPDSVLQSFMDKRFGLFVHWGPVTLRGTEIGWSRNHQVAQSDYDSLYKEFDPVLFNAEAWVKIAKNAGMKYLTITAKHHDGFCLWPSAFTKYNIGNTPYKKDIVGQLATACKKYGIKFCIYYSVLDWYSPDYPLHNDGKKTPDPNSDMNRYIIYMKNQLKELITTYHPYMLWFDGNWESPWTQEMAVDMYKYIKGIDRDVIINNRLGKSDHKSITSETVGDYATPEQEIGKIDMKDPWESCITICNQWSWKPNDEMKSLSQCIRTLSRTASGNGNLLLNVGPMPDGRIEKRQSERLEEIGKWLQKNEVAIFGTRGGPYTPDSVFSSTRKGNKIFLHLYSNNQSSLNISAIPGMKVQKAYFLEGGKINLKESESKISLSWTGAMPDPVCSIIVMEMNSGVDLIPLLQ